MIMFSHKLMITLFSGAINYNSIKSSVQHPWASLHAGVLPVQTLRRLLLDATQSGVQSPDPDTRILQTVIMILRGCADLDRYGTRAR